MIVPFVHALAAVIVILAGLDDWKKRQAADRLTWPLFVAGSIGVIVRAARLDLLPLFISAFLLVIWYFDWMGGADARISIGLWGLWPLGGFAGLVGPAVWGLALAIRRRGKDSFPALVPMAFGVALTFFIEVATMWA